MHTPPPPHTHTHTTHTHNTHTHHTQYGVVIDAGSTHTTLYVYRWEVPTSTLTHSPTGKVQQVYFCPLSHSNSSKPLQYNINRPSLQLQNESVIGCSLLKLCSCRSLSPPPMQPVSTAMLEIPVEWRRPTKHVSTLPMESGTVRP